MKILVINGVNLNLLGSRNKEIYGTTSYNELVKMIKNHAKENNIKVKCVCSNYEGKIVEYIQKSKGKYDGIILNAGAYTHYSIAIRDAIEAVSAKVVEVHISDINKREEFRHISMIKDVCVTSIVGHGVNGYLEAMDYLKGGN